MLSRVFGKGRDRPALGRAYLTLIAGQLQLSPVLTGAEAVLARLRCHFAVWCRLLAFLGVAATWALSRWVRIPGYLAAQT